MGFIFITKCAPFLFFHFFQLSVFHAMIVEYFCISTCIHASLRVVKLPWVNAHASLCPGI